MDLSGFELWAKDRHDMLMLLNPREAGKNRTFHRDFVMVLGSREVKDFDVGSGVGFFEAAFHFLWSHRSEAITKY